MKTEVFLKMKLYAVMYIWITWGDKV